MRPRRHTFSICREAFFLLMYRKGDFVPPYNRTIYWLLKLCGKGKVELGSFIGFHFEFGR
jgi:hypothetical protein